MKGACASAASPRAMEHSCNAWTVVWVSRHDNDDATVAMVVVVVVVVVMTRMVVERWC